MKQENGDSYMTNKKIPTEKPVLARNQKAAIHCNDNYHALFEQATDAIMVTDFKGNFVDVNSSIFTMFGYTKEELLQLNVATLLDPERMKWVKLIYKKNDTFWSNHLQQAQAIGKVVDLPRLFISKLKILNLKEMKSYYSMKEVFVNSWNDGNY